jgi:hypothetical protein
MIQLSITKKPLIRTGKRGTYSEAQNEELLNLENNSSLALNLKALASKWNRGFINLRRHYYRLHSKKKAIIMKELSKPTPEVHTFSVGKSKQNTSKYNSVKNAWTEFEVEIIREAFLDSKDKSKTAIEISELLEGRTPAAIMSKHYHLNKNESKKDTTFIKEEKVLMYKAVLDDSLHESEVEAIKANIMAIVDEATNEKLSDEDIHSWFHNNKDKVNYLLNHNPNTIWK